MKAGFNKTCIAVKTSDGKNFSLFESFSFTDQFGNTYEVPVGFETDGPSIPRALWIDLPPFGNYWLPAVLHDFLYRKTKLDKAMCDNVFYNAMIANGVPRIRAGEIYNGVHLGGWSSFNSDRSQIKV